jgi:ribosomal protein S8
MSTTASFTIRIELHRDATSNDYQQIKKMLKANGFIKTVKDTEGNSFHLPSYEYCYTGAISREALLEKVDTILKGNLAKYAILITESAGLSWIGLKSRD